MDTESTQSRMPQASLNRSISPTTLPHVVIIGGGFGGLAAAVELAKQPVRVTVIDRNNHHLFQPMLYQVATATLMPNDIASPLREILRHKNTHILLAEVTGVDTQQQLVLLENDTSVPYDYLILATGARNNYFDHPEWANIAPGMKTLDDALLIKMGLLSTLEAAEQEPDNEKRKAMLTAVLIGGGPTGCELAAMLAENKRQLMKSNFQRVSMQNVRIVLVEGAPRLLASFHPSLARKVQRRLTRASVEVRTGVRITEITDQGVMIGNEFLATRSVLWMAGVKASPAGQWLQTEVDHQGRVKVQSDLSVPGHPNIFVIGDTAHVMQRGKALPGLAQPAIQGGN
ncbi:MAG TPA: NAD(P)/FAD-dependent oxidoreductase, partial [Ktedonobacteraceae bacterium]